jgi:hypothetical protein
MYFLRFFKKRRYGEKQYNEIKVTTFSKKYIDQYTCKALKYKATFIIVDYLAV